VFHEYFQSIRDELGDLAVVSPDVGNVKIANMYAQMLDAELAIIDKRRLSGDHVRSTSIVGDVRGRNVLMVDDMISTAGTVCEAARTLKDHGADQIMVAATHPVMCGPAVERLTASPINRIIVTNTIPSGNRYAGIEDRIVELCVGPLFSGAIDHIHYNKSVSALFRQFGDSKR
ncbi:MAG: ribose-phosphate diphosphokinase, partial [Planctomycetaceae bacterium]|nr:ribose-phosphate diphosphokinase [Planctomycetaceae bacterium]